MRNHALNRLSAAKAASLKEPGKYPDGGGLYLVITDSGRSWTFRYSRRGSRCEIGLGSARVLTLAKAREQASEYRAMIADGLDPKKEREQFDRRVTFGSFADAYVETMSSSWRNPKHVAQWKMTLTVYAAPIRKTIIEEIDTDEILKVLKPLWTRVPETAGRLRGRIESVLDAAKVAGLRDGDNPARWRGHLDQLLPKRRKGGRGHHAALPFHRIKPFIRKLRAREAVAARALELIILTAARSSEVINAEWDEFDLRQKVWIVPAERMKMGRAHRVPLTAPVVALLSATPESDREGLVFKRGADGKPLTNMAMPMLLRRMEVDETVHGFRSTFRDWAAETTNFSNEVCEMALAHSIPGKSEAAYRRGDLFKKRRRLMEGWAKYCGYMTSPD